MTIAADRFPALLAGARAGDAAAVRELFTEFQPRLLRFLRGVEPRAADDVAGDVWLAVAQGVARFDGDLDGFSGWLFTIARRRLADYRRTAARRPVDPMSSLELAALLGGSDPATDVLDRLSGQDAADAIAAALPPDLAEVLLLRVVGGLDVAVVAEVMGRTSNWVRVMQHRALKRLALLMSPSAPAASVSVNRENDVASVIPWRSPTISPS